ncbi:MAG: hypothetical protein DWQ35_15535 [Planctomycetota bacterium]|nr:MAG: hypothetical protein DWQ35_15535 [Planctomycetota bacterium]
MKKWLLIALASGVLLGASGLGVHQVARAKRASAVVNSSLASHEPTARSVGARNLVRSTVFTDQHLGDDAFVESFRVDRIPADFEPQRAILLSGQHLLNGHADTFASIVAATQGRTTVVALVDSDTEEEQLDAILQQRNLDGDHVLYVGLPHDSQWIRDFGPRIAKRNDGSIVVIDAPYGEQDRANDDVVPTALANCLNLPVVRPPLAVDGGNLLTNGEGLLVTTQRLIAENAFDGHNSGTIAEVLREFYGAKESVILLPLVGEPTGHVDVFATFCDTRTIIVGEYDPKVDPVNAAILDRNAERLARVMTRQGPLQVVRIPMPPRDNECWRSYTNVVYANGALLMPTYSDMDRSVERLVIHTYRELLPDWQVVGIDAEALCAKGGALHCATADLSMIDRLPLCWSAKSFLNECGRLPHSLPWSELCDYHRDDLRRLYGSSSRSPNFDTPRQRGSRTAMPAAR